MSDEGASKSSAFQIAVDIGGTFTDGVLLDESNEEIQVAKSLTTPSDPGDGVATVVQSLLAKAGHASGAVKRVVHGTTLITNTLVERRGVRPALVVTEGTLDCLDIRRELRYDIYDLDADYPEALVPVGDRYTLSERLSPGGEVWRSLDLKEVEAVAQEIANGGFEDYNICTEYNAPCAPEAWFRLPPTEINVKLKKKGTTRSRKKKTKGTGKKKKR